MLNGDLEGISFSGYEPKKLFHQKPDGTFEEVSFVDGFSSRADGRSLLVEDLDGDGDQELLLLNRGAPKLQLFRNDGENGNALELRLRAATAPKDAPTALVKVGTAAGTRVFPVLLARGYGTATPGWIHVGLGEAKDASVEVVWREGATQALGVLKAGSAYQVEEGKAPVATAFAPKVSHRAPAPPMRLEALGLKKDEGKKPTVVALLSVGCEPCRKEVPALNALRAKKGAVVVGVVADGEDQVAATTKALGVEFPTRALTTDAAERLEAFGPLLLPMTLVYGPDGALLRITRSPEALANTL